MAKARRERPPGKDHGARAPDVRRPVSPPDRISGALALFGVALTAYLTVVALSQTSVAFCTTGSGCDVVQGSRFSTFLRLPIALWGLGLYALIALFSFLPARAVKRWRRVWSLSLIGLTVSLYLTAAGFLALQAVCLWCLLSLATLVALFAWNTLHRPDNAPGTGWRSWLLNHAVVLAALIGSLGLAHSGLLTPPENPRLKALAEHLDARGARFYGAHWCPNCNEQKALFGRSAERLPYVECSPEGRRGAVAFECVSADVNAYPTWVIRGRRYTEVLQPEELARRSGFDWDGYAPP